MAIPLKVFAAIAFMALSAGNSDAQQRQVCGPEKDILNILYQRWNEFPVFRGDDGQGRKFILTRADGKGSWTLIIVSEGKACIADAGGRSQFDKGV